MDFSLQAHWFLWCLFHISHTVLDVILVWCLHTEGTTTEDQGGAAEVNKEQFTGGLL